MRAFLNAILTFIGATSLTDGEFDALTIETATYDQATYEALLAVLVSRESISSMTDKLALYFRAKGVEVSVVSTGKSNIFLGSAL